MTHDKFFYKKEICFAEKSTEYAWYLVDKKTRQGVHFHGVKSHEIIEDYSMNQFGFIAYGLEVHRKEPQWEGQTPISDCWVIGGDCYCDGTSLTAKEKLGHVNPEKCDDEVFVWLEWFYRIQFERD